MRASNRTTEPVADPVDPSMSAVSSDPADPVSSSPSLASLASSPSSAASLSPSPAPSPEGANATGSATAVTLAAGASWGSDIHPPTGMLDLSASHPIGEVVYRRRAQVGGRVRSVRVRPWGEVLTYELVVADATGAITVAFLGRRSIAGVTLGTSITVEGMVGKSNGKLVILNPAYDLRAV